MTHEYAFDVKLAAVVRILAEDEKQARTAIGTALDAADLNVVIQEGSTNVRITEASAYVDDADGPTLFEIDGEPVDD